MTDSDGGVTYHCEDCGYENTIDGPPIKSRTCPECGGRYVPVGTAGGG